jgi:Pvc16 N-terminal domain
VNSVIPEVDFALRSLIEREAASGTEVEVVFDAPTKDWAGRRNVPTIDVYLYDIREDLRRRERGLVNEYDGERIRARRLPPRHFKLSYLVTAWTQRPEDEHRLLSALLSCFLRHDAMPEDLLTGPLADLGLPVPITVSLPPPEDRSFADVWSALGGELKPSLDVVISAPTDTGQQYLAAPPVVSPGVLSLGGLGEWPPRETRGRAAVARDDGRSRVVGDLGSGNADATGDAQGLTWQQLAASGSGGSPVRDQAAPLMEEKAVGEKTWSRKGSDEPPGDQPGTEGRPRRRRQGGINQQ